MRKSRKFCGFGFKGFTVGTKKSIFFYLLRRILMLKNKFGKKAVAAVMAAAMTVSAT